MSLTSRTPSAQIVVAMVSSMRRRVGQGPRSANRTTAGRAMQAATDEAAAQHLAAGDPGLGHSLVDRGEDRGPVLFAGGHRVPVVHHLAVVHQLPRPLDRTHADEQQRQAEREAEADVLGVGAQWTEVDVHLLRHGEVDDHEDDRQDRHHAEEGGDDACLPVAGLLVDVAEPGEVLLQPRIGNREPVLVEGGELTGFGRNPIRIVGCPAIVAAGGQVRAHRAFTPFAAIQIAKPISTPRPAIQAHRPSATGPRPPNARPPRFGCSCSSFR